MPPAPPTLPGRAHAAAATHPRREEVYVFGGGGKADAFTGDRLHNDLWVVGGDGAARQVAVGESQWFPPREAHSAMAVTPAGRVYIHGGVTQDECVSSALCYADVKRGRDGALTAVWRRVELHWGCGGGGESAASTTPRRRGSTVASVVPALSDHAMVHLPQSDTLLLVGGIGPGGERNTDVYCIDVADGGVSVLNPAPAEVPQNAEERAGDAAHHAEALPTRLCPPDGRPALLMPQAVCIGDGSGVVVYGGRAAMADPVCPDAAAADLPANEEVYLLDCTGPPRWVWIAQSARVPPSWLGTTASPATPERDALLWRYRSAHKGATYFAGIDDLFETHRLVWQRHPTPAKQQLPAPRTGATILCPQEVLMVAGGVAEDGVAAAGAAGGPPLILHDTWRMRLFDDVWAAVDPALLPVIVHDGGGEGATTPRPRSPARPRAHTPAGDDAVYHFFDADGNSRLDIDWEDRMALGRMKRLYSPERPATALAPSPPVVSVPRRAATPRPGGPPPSPPAKRHPRQPPTRTATPQGAKKRNPARARTPAVPPDLPAPADSCGAVPVIWEDTAAVRADAGSPSAVASPPHGHDVVQDAAQELPLEFTAEGQDKRSAVHIVLKPDPPSTFRGRIRQVLEHDQPESAMEQRVRQRNQKLHRCGVVSSVTGHHPCTTHTTLRNRAGGTGHIISHVHLTTDVESFATDIMLSDPTRQLKVCVRLQASLSERTKRDMLERIYNLRETERRVLAEMALLREHEARRAEALQEVQRDNAQRQAERDAEAAEMDEIRAREAAREVEFGEWELERARHRAGMEVEVEKAAGLDALRQKETLAIEQRERDREALVREQELRLAKLSSQEEELHAGRLTVERERAGIQREREQFVREREWEQAQIAEAEQEKTRLETQIAALMKDIGQRTQAITDAETERQVARGQAEAWKTKALLAQSLLDASEGREEHETDIAWQRRKAARDHVQRMASAGQFMSASLRLAWPAPSTEQITYFILGSAMPRVLASSASLVFEQGEKPDATSFVKTATLSAKIVSGLTRLDTLSFGAAVEESNGTLTRSSNGTALGQVTRTLTPPLPSQWASGGPGRRGSLYARSGKSPSMMHFNAGVPPSPLPKEPSGGMLGTPAMVRTASGIAFNAPLSTPGSGGGVSWRGAEAPSPGSPRGWGRKNTGLKALMSGRRGTRSRVGSKAGLVQPEGGTSAVSVTLHGETLGVAAASAETLLEALAFTTQPSSSAVGMRVVEVTLTLNGVTLTAQRSVEVIEHFVDFPERDRALTYVEGAGAASILPYLTFPGLDEITASSRDTYARDIQARLVATYRQSLHSSRAQSRAASPTTTPRHSITAASMPKDPAAAHLLAPQVPHLVPMPSCQLSASGGAFVTIRSVSGWHKEDLLVCGDGVETKAKSAVLLSLAGDELAVVRYGRIGDIAVALTAQNIQPWLPKQAISDTANAYLGIAVHPSGGWDAVETICRQICYRNNSSNPSRQKRGMEIQVFFGMAPGAEPPAAAVVPPPRRGRMGGARQSMPPSSTQSPTVVPLEPAQLQALPTFLPHGGAMALHFAQTVEITVVSYDEPTEIHVTASDLNYAFPYAFSTDPDVAKCVSARTEHRMQVCKRARVVDEDTDIIDEGTMKLYLNTLSDGDQMTFHMPYSPGLELVEGVHEDTGEAGHFFSYQGVTVAAVYFEEAHEVEIEFVPGVARIATVEAILHSIAFHCDPEQPCTTGSRALIIELVVGEMDVLCKQISIDVEPPHLLIPSNVREMQYKEGSPPLAVAILQATREMFPVALIHFSLMEGAEPTDALLLKGSGTPEAVPWPRGFAGVPPGIVSTEAVAPEIYLLRVPEEHELYLFVASPMPSESVKGVLRRLAFVHGSRNPKNLTKVLVATTQELTKPIIPTESSAALVIKIMPTDDATELRAIESFECVVGSEADRVGCLIAPDAVVHDEDTDFFDAGYLVVESADEGVQIGLASIEAQQRRYIAATTMKLGMPKPQEVYPSYLVHMEPSGAVYAHNDLEGYMAFRERLPANAGAAEQLLRDGLTTSRLIGRVGSENIPYRRQPRGPGAAEAPVFAVSFFDGEAVGLDVADRVPRVLVQCLLRSLVVKPPPRVDPAGAKYALCYHCNAGNAPVSNEGYAANVVTFAPPVVTANGACAATVADFAHDARNVLVPNPALANGFSFKSMVQKGGTLQVEFEGIDDHDTLYVMPPFAVGKDGAILNGKAPFATARRESVTLDKRLLVITFEEKATKGDAKTLLAFLKCLSYGYGADGGALGIANLPASLGGAAVTGRKPAGGGGGGDDHGDGSALHAAGAPTFASTRRVLLMLHREPKLPPTQVACVEAVFAEPGPTPHLFTLRNTADHVAYGEPSPILTGFTFVKEETSRIGGCTVEVRPSAPNTYERITLHPACELPSSAIVIPTPTRCRVVFSDDADRAAVLEVVRRLQYSSLVPGRHAVEATVTVVESNGCGTAFSRTVWVTTAPPIVGVPKVLGVLAPSKTPSKPVDLLPGVLVELPPKRKTLRGATVTIELGQNADIIAMAKQCALNEALDPPAHAVLSFGRGVAVANGAIAIGPTTLGRCPHHAGSKLLVLFDARKDVATAAAVASVLRAVQVTSNRQNVEACVRVTIADKDGGLFGCCMLVTGRAGKNEGLTPLALSWT